MGHTVIHTKMWDPLTYHPLSFLLPPSVSPFCSSSANRPSAAAGWRGLERRRRWAASEGRSGGGGGPRRSSAAGDGGDAAQATGRPSHVAAELPPFPLPRDPPPPPQPSSLRSGRHRGSTLPKSPGREGQTAFQNKSNYTNPIQSQKVNLLRRKITKEGLLVFFFQKRWIRTSCVSCTSSSIPLHPYKHHKFVVNLEGFGLIINQICRSASVPPPLLPSSAHINMLIPSETQHGLDLKLCLFTLCSIHWFWSYYSPFVRSLKVMLIPFFSLLYYIYIDFLFFYSLKVLHFLMMTNHSLWRSRWSCQQLIL